LSGAFFCRPADPLIPLLQPNFSSVEKDVLSGADFIAPLRIV
jgi:hypothetical protein